MKQFSVSNASSLGKEIFELVNRFIEGDPRISKEHKNVSVHLTLEIIEIIDSEIKGTNTSRSEYILEVIKKFVKLLEWTGIDFPLTSSRSEIFRVALIIDTISNKWDYFREKKKEHHIELKKVTNEPETLESYLEKNGLKIIGVA